LLRIFRGVRLCRESQRLVKLQRRRELKGERIEGREYRAPELDRVGDGIVDAEVAGFGGCA
jgi:hypothetical protein